MGIARAWETRSLWSSVSSGSLPSTSTATRSSSSFSSSTSSRSVLRVLRVLYCVTTDVSSCRPHSRSSSSLPCSRPSRLLRSCSRTRSTRSPGASTRTLRSSATWVRPSVRPSLSFNRSFVHVSLCGPHSFSAAVPAPHGALPHAARRHRCRLPRDAPAPRDWRRPRQLCAPLGQLLLRVVSLSRMCLDTVATRDSVRYLRQRLSFASCSALDPFIWTAEASSLLTL